MVLEAASRTIHTLGGQLDHREVLDNVELLDGLAPSTLALMLFDLAKRGDKFTTADADLQRMILESINRRSEGAMERFAGTFERLQRSF
jgi:hypothetical protein